MVPLLPAPHLPAFVAGNRLVSARCRCRCCCHRGHPCDLDLPHLSAVAIDGGSKQQDNGDHDAPSLKDKADEHSHRVFTPYRIHRSRNRGPWHLLPSQRPCHWVSVARCLPSPSRLSDHPSQHQELRGCHCGEGLQHMQCHSKTTTSINDDTLTADPQCIPVVNAT